jgi:hypothetical protein
MLDSWPCLQSWTCSYLREKLSDHSLSVDVTPDGHGDCVVDGNFVQPEQRTMKFGIMFFCVSLGFWLPELWHFSFLKLMAVL